MFRTFSRLIVASTCVLAGFAVAPPAAVAQDGGAVVVQDVHRLGGSTALNRRPLTNVASLKRMSDDPRLVANIRTVLDQGGVSSLGDGVVAAFAGATSSVVGGECADATPAAGVIVECDVTPGQTLQWMAHRPRGAAPALLRNIRWAGAKPFKAYLFTVTEGERTYTFVVPKVCGNVSLMHMVEQPRAAAVVTPAVMPPAPAPPPPAVVVAPMIEPAPAPREEAAAPEQTAAPSSSAAVVASTPFFVDGLFGKERRVRPVDGDLEAGQCSPLAGVKLGIAKRFANNWEIGTAVGVALSLVQADDKVREHALFIDVEANRYVGNGFFVGFGLSAWDLTRSDSFTPGAMIHLGLPIAPHARFPVYFLVEGRAFLDGVDDIDNNYQFWGGLRVRF